MGVEKTEERRDFKRFHSGALYYCCNGLDLDRERDTILSRDHLVEKLRSNLYESLFVMLCSPPATGKTTLCPMLVNKYQIAHKIISFRTGKIPSDELEDSGINLKQQKAQPRDQLYVVILDDSQNIYKFKDFWDVLVKGVWIPTNYVFIVCATYILKSGTDTPTELQLVPRLSHDDCLLTNEESEELFDRT